VTVPPLTPAEMMVIAQVGCARRIRNLQRGSVHRNGHTPTEPWDVNVEGAAAEYLVAQELHASWTAITPLHAYPEDVGGGIHVRQTNRPDGGLPLYPDDPPGATFVLVTGRMPHQSIVGSITAKDGLHQRYWRADWPRPTFCVPQSELEPWTPKPTEEARP